ARTAVASHGPCSALPLRPAPALCPCNVTEPTAARAGDVIFFELLCPGPPLAGILHGLGRPRTRARGSRHGPPPHRGPHRARCAGLGTPRRALPRGSAPTQNGHVESIPDGLQSVWNRFQG